MNRSRVVAQLCLSPPWPAPGPREGTLRHQESRWADLPRPRQTRLFRSRRVKAWRLLPLPPHRWFLQGRRTPRSPFRSPTTERILPRPQPHLQRLLLPRPLLPQPLNRRSRLRPRLRRRLYRRPPPRLRRVTSHLATGGSSTASAASSPESSVNREGATIDC